MRIISGFLKARRFSIPKNFPSRPTTNFAKEGLFNVLENKIDLIDLKILDLCAGTGNITFEFISRESGTVTAVDANTNCLKFLKKNAENFNISDQIDIIKSDVLKYVQKTDQKFDLIFADPPYAYPHYEEMVKTIFERQLIQTEGWVIIEHGRETDLSHMPHFEFVRQYGNVYFSFFQNN